jgi:hypothetical protein
MAKKNNGELPDPIVTGAIGLVILMLFFRLKHEGKLLKEAKAKTTALGMVEKHHGYQTWVVNVPGSEAQEAMRFNVRARTEVEAQTQARHEIHTKSLPDYTTIVPEYVWRESRWQ